MPAAGFKAVLSQWASGVSVVTTKDDGMLYGLTVSSFSSVSLDPPLVLVCLANTNRIVPMIEAADGFAVSILAGDQQAVSQYFSRPGRLPTADFTEIDGEWTPSGMPVIARSLAWVSCVVHALVPQGDHTIAIGRVVEAGGRSFEPDHVTDGPSGRPLVYWSRQYRAIGPA